MAVLSDRDLRRRLVTGDRNLIKPCADSQVQPASIDLTLANEWRVYPPLSGTRFPDPLGPTIDMDHAKDVETRKIVADYYELRPHELVLCSTVEYVNIPHDIQAQVHGKSSLGRLGLLVHVTAGFIDPGFKGKITLEMYNLNIRPILLRAGKPICQLSLVELTRAAEFSYGHPSLKSHYQDQKEVQGSRYDG